MTLAEYVKKRNGVPIGNSNSLRNNQYRSLGAKNFSTFWNYWNPIFGYYLGMRIFKPLKNYFPRALALVITFVFCGLTHDFAVTVFRGKLSLFFSVWFLFLGIGVLISRRLKYDFSDKTWLTRAFLNLSIIGVCLLPSVYLKDFLIIQ